MAMRRALVSGATGGLGRHLVPKLAAAGYAVTASGRNATIGRELASLPRVTFEPGDLRDESVVRTLVSVAAPDAVFHCAALSSPWGPQADFVAANITATRSLATAAKQRGCTRFIHVSSPSITFRYRDQLNISEDEPLPQHFVNAYAATKAGAERVVQSLADGNFAVTILRPRGLFGEYDSVLVPRLMHVARAGRMPLFRRGNAIVDVTYLGNAADAMLLADRPTSPPGVYNITNGEPMPVRELLTRVFAAMKRDVRLVNVPYPLISGLARGMESTARLLRMKAEPPLLPYSAGLMAYSQTLDISRAKSQLGYTPAVSIAEGLERFARWQSQHAGAAVEAAA